jgi:hypothetical protein
MVVASSRRHIIWYKQELESLIQQLPEESVRDCLFRSRSLTLYLVNSKKYKQNVLILLLLLLFISQEI